MKNTLTILSLVCFFYTGFSQELPTIIPPSPEASALAKFTNVPVSHYTGLPNITVPIYTIQQKGISIPISLSYHARGVQVSETASRTGLGWSLQYGGSISRQVRGKADEHPRYGYLSNGNSFMTYSVNKETRGNVHSIESNNPDYDFYPDQFSFTAGNISGKFVLDYATGKPVIQSFDDVKITHSGMDSFKIIDSKGNTYYFGKSKDEDEKRTAQDYQTSTGKSFYIDKIVDDPITPSFIAYSSWKLIDIETANGEMINYYYDNDNEDVGATVYYRKNYDKHDTDPGGVTNSVSNITDIQKIHTRVSYVSNYEKQLSKISFNQGRDSVVFVKSDSLRHDFNGHSLERISIYNQSKLIKSFKLNYKFTTSSDRTSMLSYFTSGSGFFEQYFKRMFLESVEEEVSDGQKLPPYVFTYDSQILPSVFSSKQDYWGYYNGAVNNGPFTRPFNYGSYKDVDRRVDTLKSEAGILKEIKYPTGGIAKFTYEHNKGYIPIGMSRLKKPQINPASKSEVVKVLTKADFYNEQMNTYTPLEVQLPYSTGVTYNIFCNRLRYENDPMTTPDCIFSFTLDGQVINTGEDVVIFTGNSFNYDGTTSIGVHPINHPDLDPNLHIDGDIDFKITITYNIESSFIYGAGKRIKKVEMISQIGDTLAKEYEYNFPVEYGSNPSGAIIGLPTYLNRAENSSNIYTHYNDASSAYSSFQSNSIGYSSVIEYHGTKQNNIGKTEYTYTNMSDSGGDYYEFPYHPPTDNEWLRGKNILTKVYKKKESGEYSPVKEISNKYLYGNIEYSADFQYAGLLHENFIFTPLGGIYDWITNSPLDTVNNRTFFKMPLFMRQRNPLPSEGYPNDYVPGYRTYHLTGGTQHLLRTVETDYYDDGTLEKTTTYDYDYDKHYQLKSTENTNSKGEVLKKLYYYPIDRNDLLEITDEAKDVAVKLEGENRLELLQTDILKDNVLQSRVQYNYKDWGNNIILSKDIQTLKGVYNSTTNKLESRIVYHDYDEKGNPLEISKKDGTSIIYIWGYNKQFPVAKIENATFIAGKPNTITNSQKILINNAVSATINETTTSTENSLRTKLQLLREGFPKNMVTTYTYDPLIGVTSITDPRGETIYYEYDGFNRLKFVKDADRNILSKNEYYYKNQQ